MASRTAPPSPRNDAPPRLTPMSLLLVLIVFALLTNLGSLIVSVLMALLLGTILEGPVQRLQKRSVPRAASIAICYVGVLAALVALIVIIVPVVSDQWTEFQDTFPDQMRSLRDDWSDSSNPLLNGTGVDLLQRGIDLVEGDTTATTSVSSDAAAAALTIGSSLIGGITSIITTLVITFYYLLEKGLVRRVVLDQISPGLRDRVDALWSDVEGKVGGWLRGQLVLCAIIGTIATVSYGIIGLDFWPLLGLWAGMTEILPIVGPWIGGVPAVVVALTMGFDKAIMVAVIILTMQTLENWFLVPRVMRGAVGLTPLSVFVAILAGTQLMGVIGAVLAIPVAAGLQVILTDIVAQRRASYQIEPSAGASSGWRWMLNRALDREGGEHAYPHDDSMQIVSDVTYPGDTEPPAEPESGEDEAPIEFEEAPRLLTEEDMASDNPARAAEMTWPNNPWKSTGSVSREHSPWKAARNPETPGSK